MTALATKQKTLLRVLTCGSVDDGKSTLLGRLLFETRSIADDQLEALARDSKKYGTTGGLDLALLMDGLQAEREQGITIDVAYRFFSTPERAFIVCDSPGHVQYTRNMATAASQCEAAIVLIDARLGLLPQSKRHSLILSLMGIRHVIVAINKMDIFGYGSQRFEEIAAAYAAFSSKLGFASLHCIPLSALQGENITERSSQMPWYEGPCLLEALHSLPISESRQKPFSMPVQWVCRPDSNFRGYAGRAIGSCAIGDTLTVLPSKQTVTVAACREGATQMLELAEQVDISRGDVLVSQDSSAEVSKQLQAKLLWMASEKPKLRRDYILKIHAQKAQAQISHLKWKLDIDTGSHLSGENIGCNDIFCCQISMDRSIVFMPYSQSRELGSFILIDKLTQETVACGLIEHGLRRSSNVFEQSFAKHDLIALNGHKSCVLWLTGLSGSGKSTLAEGLESALYERGVRAAILDGDNIRLGLCKDLGFTEADRTENIRRVAEVAKLMASSGLVCVVALISPYREAREKARQIIGNDFFEVFVDASLAKTQERDVKGLYGLALEGKIPNMTGLGSGYEAPLLPDVHVKTDRQPQAESVQVLVDFLSAKGII